MSWVAHSLTTAPLSLFDANIFHPARQTLTYSDNFLLQAIALTDNSRERTAMERRAATLAGGQP